MLLSSIARVTYEMLVVVPSMDGSSTTECSSSSSDETDIDMSDDERPPSPQKKMRNNNNTTTTEVLPELEDIESFLYLLLHKSGVAEEVLIVTLIFLKRLMSCAGTKLTARNWRSLLATALLLASKTFDDLAMSNKSFSMFLPFNLESLNRFERLFLAGIKYDCNVSNEEFASQYMDLLSVGRHSDKKHSPRQMRRYSSESVRA
jgi:hypothetical protein